MSETLLKVEERDDGQCYVNYLGHEFALLSPIKVDCEYDHGYHPRAHQWDRYAISFYVLDMPQPDEKPAPKRTTYAQRIGLRRPR